MQPLVDQLAKVRAKARFLLFAMHGSLWLAAVIGAAVAAGFLDYLLRLPAWLRLAMLMMGLFAAIYTLGTRVARTLRIWPRLTTLALRLEKRIPSLSGRLASAVAFATEGTGSASGTPTDALAHRSIAEARRLVDPKQIDTLIDTSRLWRCVTAMIVAVSLVSGIGFGAPEAFGTAVGRWVAPLGDAKWPDRQRIESHTTVKIAPDNEPIRLSASVSKGDSPSLRSWVVYRFIDAEGRRSAPQRQLMTRQEGQTGVFDRRIEPVEGARKLVFCFEAGDGRSAEQTIELFPPPVLRSIASTWTPPVYAKGFAQTQNLDLLNPPRPIVTHEALAGTRVALEVEVAGAVKLPETLDAASTRAWVDATMPGLLAEALGPDMARMDIRYERLSADEGVGRFRVVWKLVRAADFRFALTDIYGKPHPDQRRFRFEVRPDTSPRATILEPAIDRQVLATAVLPLAAEVQDDVAVSQGRLVAKIQQDAERIETLVETDMAEPRTQLKHELHLAKLSVKPGDLVNLHAVAQDNFDLDGQRHKPVWSAPRRLTIISDDELIRQIRVDLAKLRERATHAKATQKRLADSPADRSTAGQQKELAQRIRAMEQTVDSLKNRIRTNRLKDAWAEQTLKDAGNISASAKLAAEQATGHLNEAASQKGTDAKSQQQKKQQADAARKQQAKVQKDLGDLINKLDQGRTAFELQERLGKLASDQAKISDDARKMLPKTLGQDKDQLSAADRKALEDIAGRQNRLSEDAKKLIQEMQSTASALDRQSTKPEDQAAAEAIRQAARIAQEQQLKKQMQNASQQTKNNQMARAQQSQQAAMDTIQQMQDQLSKAEKLRREILKRKLLELVDAIRRLHQQQKAQLDRLLLAKRFGGLDAAMLQLRRNTNAVSDQARAAGPKVEKVAEKLDEAAGHMADAVRGLRLQPASLDKVEPHERDALARLAEALKLAEELSKKASNEEQQQKRGELLKAYVEALVEQKRLRGATEDLSKKPADQRARRWRLDSTKLGDAQADLRVKLSKLGEKIRQENSIVYLSVHLQISDWADKAVVDLRRAAPGAATLFHQDLIINGIESLIEGLRRPKDDAEFNKDPAEGGGGGGGGQGGKPRLVPPIAELKLLRARQAQVNRMTRMVEKAGPETRSLMLNEITKQQKGLAEMGERLIKALQQQQGGQR